MKSVIRCAHVRARLRVCAHARACVNKTMRLDASLMNMSLNMSHVPIDEVSTWTLRLHVHFRSFVDTRFPCVQECIEYL